MTEKTYSIPQFLAAFQVGRTKAYEEIAAGRLATYRVGRRRFISARAAEAWQARLEAETALPKDSDGISFFPMA